MTAQPLLQQCGTVALDPALDCRGVCLQAALTEQLFDIAERERVPQVPTHGAKNQLGLGLSPLENRRSDCLFHDLFRLLGAVGQSCDPTLRLYHSSHRPGGDHYNSLTQGVGQIRRSKVGQTGWTNAIATNQQVAAL